jgi:hypothetical protein
MPRGAVGGYKVANTLPVTDEPVCFIAPLIILVAPQKGSCVMVDDGRFHHSSSRQLRHVVQWAHMIYSDSMLHIIMGVDFLRYSFSVLKR